MRKYFYSGAAWGYFKMITGGGGFPEEKGGCDKICVYPVLHVCGMHMYRSVFEATEKRKIFKDSSHSSGL